MTREGNTRNYTWLLHIAIWVVLFGMPFFSPRPGHPLHGGVDFARFLPTLISFLIVFYINYFLLIKKYLYQKRFGMFILWNVLLVAIASVIVHMIHSYAFPMPSQPGFMSEPLEMPRPGGPDGPGGPGGPREPGFRMEPREPRGSRSTLDHLSFIARNTLIYMAIICVAVAVKMTGQWYKDEKKRDETEKAVTEAELAALKSQINPHFLFNTLNMIGSMAELEDAETTEKMTQALAALFRYNLSTKDQIVPLAMELQVVSEYMYLQKMRFGSRVNYEVDVPADADRIRIPSFTLQPLVENAVVHGISKKEQGGTVSVKAEHLVPENGTDRILLTIRDDGLGMSSERLAQLKVRLEGTDGQPAAEENSSAAGLGIGLGNIYKRVRNLYPDGTFEIWSEEGCGTAILITIPNREEE